MLSDVNKLLSGKHRGNQNEPFGGLDICITSFIIHINNNSFACIKHLIMKSINDFKNHADCITEQRNICVNMV